MESTEWLTRWRGKDAFIGRNKEKKKKKTNLNASGNAMHTTSEVVSTAALVRNEGDVEAESNISVNVQAAAFTLRIYTSDEVENILKAITLPFHNATASYSDMIIEQNAFLSADCVSMSRMELAAQAEKQVRFIHSMTQRHTLDNVLRNLATFLPEQMESIKEAVDLWTKSCEIAQRIAVRCEQLAS
jgi:hypothetical protein